MSFTALNFWVFLPVVFVAYYLCPGRLRWAVLLIANLVFYCFAGLQYVLLLGYIIAVAYLFAMYFDRRNMTSGLPELRMGTLQQKTTDGLPELCAGMLQRKAPDGLLVACGVVLSLLPLAVFKYSGFLAENVNIVMKALNSSRSLSTMKIALPLGISFYTFSALGYVIDVANGKYAAYKNPLHLAAGISFFPCLVSGPIERQNKLVPQLLEGRCFDYTLATHGLKQIAWGLFEKLVIADNLAVYVDKVYSDVHVYSGAPLLAGALFFAFQIYCDFAGYSDMAIGIAKLFGIRLTRNFASPYFARSLQDFWRRWHISLSSWFRDYVYIPLGGNRKGKLRKQLNVVITMLVSGLWHGAAWTYIAWGGLHGLVQAAENSLGINRRKADGRCVRALRCLIVFSICTILWAFFRADSFDDAWYLIIHMFDGALHLNSYVHGLSAIGIGKTAVLLMLFEFAILFAYDFFSLKLDVIEKISGSNVWLRWCIYVLLLFVIAQLSYKGGDVNFVYAGF